jgi:hypothetical protein
MNSSYIISVSIDFYLRVLCMDFVPYLVESVDFVLYLGVSTPVSVSLSDIHRVMTVDSHLYLMEVFSE